MVELHDADVIHAGDVRAIVMMNMQNGFVKTDCPYQPIQKRIRAARVKAMCEGDKQSAAKICHYNVWFCWAKNWDKTLGFNFKMMVERMEEEYEYPDLKKAMMNLQEAQFKDPIRRPYAYSNL